MTNQSNTSRGLTEAQILRREFNHWFAHNYQDADGRYTHLPRWFKNDIWEAWTAGRAALQEQKK